jgi:hypothetical protein
MDQEVKEIEFKLSSKITFHKGGDNQDANIIFLKAPSRKNKKHTTYLKQCFFRAMKEAQGGNQSSGDSSEESDIKAKDIMILLMMSSIDVSECLEHLQSILCNGACFIDDDVPMSAFSYGQISDDDEERLLGEYMRSFLLSFWMKHLL